MLATTVTGTIPCSEAASRQYDAVIIPGGGLESSGYPRAWVIARLDAALSLRHNCSYFIVLSRGTTRRPPPTDRTGFPVDECVSSAKYLMTKGIEPERILQDSWSLDTIGNAYFARNMIAHPLMLKKLCVVTSAFHMNRTRAIFNWVFTLERGEFTLDYCVSSNEGLSNDELEARCSKEDASLDTLVAKTIPRINSLSLLAKFLLTEHTAYKAREKNNGTRYSIEDRSNLAVNSY